MSEQREKPEAVYFDSSILEGQNWPNPSVGLTEVFELVETLAIAPSIPQLVQVELRHVAERKFADRVSALRKACRELERSAPPGSFEHPQVPTNATALGAYDTQVVAAVERHGIEVSRLPATALADLLEDSAAHREPFRPRDNSFRDSIIALSVVDDMLRRGRSVGWLIASDGLFDDMRGYLHGHGIEVVQDVTHASTGLRAFLTRATFDLLQKRNDEVSDALREQLSTIAAYLESHLQIPEAAFDFYGKVIQIDSIQAKQVENVITGIEVEPVGATPTEGTAQLALTVGAFVQPYVVPASRILSLGNPSDESPRFALLDDGEERSFDLSASLNFTVHRSAAGQLQVEYTGARYGDAEQQLKDILVRHVLTRKGGRPV